MKTAEEFLQAKGWKQGSTGMFDLNGLADLMEHYANEKAKAALEEAAEKVRIKYNGDIYQSPLKLINPNDISSTIGNEIKIEIDKESIRSLIPNQEPK